jgi:asparagine synthase (glutamine-hydrolysing)
MCGIAGVIELTKLNVDFKALDLSPAELCHTMLTHLNHRGPDEAGIVTHGKNSLGNVRLSILDISHGTQPISNEKGNIWIVYNGEIYDIEPIREELGNRGCRFQTRTDTEVILYLYQEYGEEFYNRLNGEFSVAIMDTRNNDCKIILARDLWGTRPLHFSFTDKGLIFSSEIKSLLSVSADKVSLNQQAFLETITAWAVCPPNTSFNGVKTLSPGEMMVISGNMIQSRSFLNEFIKNSVQQKSKKDKTTIKNLIEDSVKRRLVADVPIGVYLSGGLDSSIVTLLARKHYEGTLNSYSIAFEDTAFDESAFQTEVAKALGTKHHSLKMGNNELINNFIPATLAGESFVFRSAFVPMYLLSKFVRDNKGKVVLTGEGADEFFSGYDIFRELKIIQGIGQKDFSLLTNWASDLYKYIPEFNSLDKRLLLGYYSKIKDTSSEIPLSHRQRWLAFSKVKNYFDIDWNIEHLAGKYKAVLPVMNELSVEQNARMLESLSLLHGYLLSVQGDRMALANSVETRLPFLDRCVTSYMLGLGPLELIEESQEQLKEKHLLYDSFLDSLPEVFKTRRKTPYLAPDIKVFGPLFRELILDNSSSLKEQLPFVKFELVEAIFNKPENKVSRIENTLLFSLASASVLSSHNYQAGNRSQIPLKKNIKVAQV